MNAARTPRLFLRLCLSITAAVSVWLTRPSLANQRDTDNEGQPVRIGVVAFDEHGRDHERLYDVLRKVAAASKAPLRFQVARGTYGDVAHWMTQGQIDLAVVTPGLFPLGESPPPGADPRDRVRYLATVTLGRAVTRFASDARKTDRRHDRTRALTLVRSDSALRSAADLDRAARERRLRVLMVHPMSVSGGIAPLYALAERGVDLATLPIEYTHSHAASVRALLDVADGGKGSRGAASQEMVAFVWDDALRLIPDAADELRAIPFPELNQLVIPSDVLVARGNFARADEILGLLLAHRDADEHAVLSEPGDWRELHSDVARWRFAAGPVDDRRDRVALDEIGSLLVHFARTQPVPPRLALVLSGGGAKCSYQVGAVAAIEEELAELRTANPTLDLDIHLVVGTSGGAINALPVALGITASAAGREHFRDVWTSLDQRDIVRPSRAARVNIGLWFVLLQAAVVLVAVRRLVGTEDRRALWFGAVLAVLGAAQLTLAFVDFKPWRMLGTNHAVHHLWLWMAFGAGVGLELARPWRRSARRCGTLSKRNKLLAIPGRFVRPALWLGLFGLPLVHIVTVLFFQQTLSGGEGMERALTAHYPELIDGELSRRRLPPLELSAAGNDAERLRSIGRQLVERNLPTRDLVITGSRLRSAREAIKALPPDLYFFLPRQVAEPADRTAAPPFGARGVALRDRPDLTLDVVLGSGSIFPVFPSRSLPDFPATGAELELVDGGFAHNSPIEAAVLWGATHIILIEASPQVRLERTNFATNAMASFDHLYEQSQLLDARARGKVSIFTLAPIPPHLCVLDFADNLIEESIARLRRRSGTLRQCNRSGCNRRRKRLPQGAWRTGLC